jgi:hypothetical protein
VSMITNSRGRCVVLRSRERCRLGCRWEGLATNRANPRRCIRPAPCFKPGEGPARGDPITPEQNFAANFRELREASNLTQMEVAVERVEMLSAKRNTGSNARSDPA